MEILNDEIERKVRDNIIEAVLHGECNVAISGIVSVLDELYANIPDNKRVSYGRVHTIKVLSKYLYSHLAGIGAPVYQTVSTIFGKSDDYRSKGVSLGILSFHGLGDYKKVPPHFQSAAASSDWNMRELAQMFFRKLIKKHPDEVREYLLQLVKSEDAKLRRFVSETLRPVQENRWFTYPRTSVGNDLSDLARRVPNLVYDMARELVDSGDENSYWIAYRACRNLVKKEPIKVMDLLRVNEYEYKKRVHRRSDYKRD